MSTPLVRGFKTGRMGSPLADAKSEVPRGHAPAEVAKATLLGHRDDDPLAGSSAWLGRLADPLPVDASKSKGGSVSPSPRYDQGASPPPSAFLPTISSTSLTLFKVLFSSFLRPLTEFTALFGLHSQTTRLADNAAVAHCGPGTTGCHSSRRPIPWDLRPSVQRTLADYTERRKAADSHISGSFPFAATRGILLVFPPDLGSHPKARPPGHGGNRRQGSLQSQGLWTPLRATQGQGGRSHHCQAGALGAKCFSANLARGGQGRPSARPRRLTATARGGAAGHGWGEHAGRGRPGRCTLDLVASGATYAQRLDGSRDSAIHTKHRDFATLFIGARAKISAVPSRLGYRGSRSDAKATRWGARASFALAQIAESGCFGVRPRPPLVADAEPAGRRVANAARLRDSTGAGDCRRRRRWASRCSSLALVQWTSRTLSGGRTANAAADPNTSPTIQSVGATGGVYKGQGRVNAEADDSRLLGIPR
ncbi:hypothetical protein H6P81_021470 [Aristolochia fimbriata]|uniref:Uncharacterized protein n=1 Tax=Aristolochia fimbriata TaxID=158543 RepID=A0AAV7DQX8_ARIFI|nr:hypothetical protein H6P81_021470 [Aristolochia fimbriata]